MSVPNKSGAPVRIAKEVQTAMMIFKKAIPRRSFLRGMGATFALPLLDGMVPAFAGPADTSAKPPVRLGIVYSGNGQWPMDKWTPKTEGPNFELTQTIEQLKPYRDQLLVLSGLAQKEAFPREGDGGGEHSRTTATFLTGVRPKRTDGKDIHAGTSVDQIVAEKIGKDTQLKSIEASLFPSDLVGTCESEYTCLYISTLCWRTPTTPLPMERIPRALFERLFGDSDSTDRAARLDRIQEQRSILDWVTEDVSKLEKQIGPSDRAKIEEYLEAVRDIERRIQLAEEQSNRELPSLERPAGVPASYEDYAKLMIDLLMMAWQVDLTRVITFSLAREMAGDRAYPEIGISDIHHSLSHHQNNPVMVEKLFKINVYHMKMFAYMLAKLRATKEGDGNLLDHSLILRGCGLSNGNIHQHDNLPILLLGGANGKLKGGRHIRYPDDTPTTNLYLTMLDILGIPVEHFGDSTGRLNLLPV